MPEFVFATCLPGIESAVKLEVARTRPDLRFAYSRPGLVTFKATEAVGPDDPPGSVFARVWGRSIGAASDPAAAAHHLAFIGADRLHVFGREPDGGADLAPWIAKLSAGGDGSSAEPDDDRRATPRTQWVGLPVGDARVGELVADVIVPPGGEPAWVGAHRHDATRSAMPGGGLPMELPPESPSRAYAKLEEAIAWARLPVTAGQVALEIGCAPGGALLALAKRGVEAWGVDTGEIAPQVAALAGVHHLPIKVGALRWEQLPARVDWLLVDVNLAPQVALHEVSRLMPRLGKTLIGAVFTLKMNDWAFVGELPKLADRIREMGFAHVQLRHLPSNRREVCAVALRQTPR